jgi:hypothetical protein
MMGEFSTPDPYTVISERSLKRRLNSVNVFDFDYEPKEGDFLELFLKCTTCKPLVIVFKFQKVLF